MNATIEQILLLIDEAYDRSSWHGTNLRGSLRGLSAERASWRPTPRHHNIWEETLHCAYWKYAIWRRLTGQKRGSFPLKGSNWWVRPAADASDAAWQSDVKILATTHTDLRAAIAGLSGRDLMRVAPGKPTLVGRLVRGVAAHDIYHAGQIQLLKRLQGGR